jgi:hypothetical protein
MSKKELSVSGAARHLNIDPKWVRTMIDRGFLKRPLTARGIAAGWKRYQEDKARRSQQRATPGLLDELARRERIRSLELASRIKSLELVADEHVEVGIGVVFGLLKSDAQALVGYSVANGGDRAALEDLIDTALSRICERTAEVAAMLEPSPEALAAATARAPLPVPANSREEEAIAKIRKRQVANDRLEGAYIRCEPAVGNIEGMVTIVRETFIPIPDAPEFVIGPLEARTAAVIDHLRTGRDPHDLVP